MASKYLNRLAQRSARDVVLTSWIRYGVSLFPTLHMWISPLISSPGGRVRSHLFKLLEPSFRINVYSILCMFPLQQVRTLHTPLGVFQSVCCSWQTLDNARPKVHITYYIKPLLQGLRCLTFQRSVSSFWSAADRPTRTT